VATSSNAERTLARLPAVATAELVEQYERAARLLRSMIANSIRRGALGTARERRKQLAAVKRTLAELRAKTDGLTTLSIAGGYRVGAQAADLSIEDVLPGAIAEELVDRDFAAGANRAAVVALQAATEQRLREAALTVGRETDDVFRRVGLEQVTLGTAAGLSQPETAKRIAAELAEQGVTGLVDKGGRRWKLDVYAAMVARTTQREAATLGTVDRMLQVGLDLVTVSEHAGSCEICKPYEGKTYSLTGRTEGFERIKVYPPFHPNCAHVLTAAAANLQFALELAAAA
jgi:minor capsid protein 2